MAFSENNPIIDGFSGKLGKWLVFRQSAGDTIVATRPRPTEIENSDKQVVIRQRFLDASRYARSVTANPVTKAAYKALAGPRQSAYNLAIADYFRPPVIEEIDLSAYSGQVGQTIKVKATDDFKVKVVKVTIFRSDGSVQEQGNAVADPNGLDWLYATTTANVAAADNRLEVIAEDMPGNLTTRQKQF
jgi:hypothetical protein